MSHPLVVNKKSGKKFDVYVGRPSKWGNPFTHLGTPTRAEFMVPTRADAIRKYKEYLFKHPELIEAAKKELKGKVLCCWCAPLDCHADILAEVANEEHT